MINPKGAGISQEMPPATAITSSDRRRYRSALRRLARDCKRDRIDSRDGRHEFWIGGLGSSPAPLHLAFAAWNRAEVRAFHAAALSAGGRGNGAPGIRGHYHPNYYGAFVVDPDGHNIEVISHAPADRA